MPRRDKSNNIGPTLLALHENILPKDWKTIDSRQGEKPSSSREEDQFMTVVLFITFSVHIINSYNLFFTMYSLDILSEYDGKRRSGG